MYPWYFVRVHSNPKRIKRFHTFEGCDPNHTLSEILAFQKSKNAAHYYVNKARVPFNRTLTSHRMANR